ncbi:MAG: type II toxin-antitoxin system Phd/YefM family antitoxin [Candidatus Eisenbacteria bacterium]|nr:type II toxin-antitoxin system Phd/YefM family antitoxin [Candidatus Eisenbacteria bacterium]
MARTTDVTSFSEHRKHLREHLDQCRQTGRPMFITNNGQTDGVLLSPESFDALAEKAELVETLAMLDRGMEEVRAGRGQPLDEAVRAIAEKLGLRLER